MSVGLALRGVRLPEGGSTPVLLELDIRCLKNRGIVSLEFNQLDVENHMFSSLSESQDFLPNRAAVGCVSGSVTRH